MSSSRKVSSAPSRILLVDDNHFGNVARKSVLEEQGFLVESVLCGEEALKICKESQFDLVVTDLKMTQMSGLELIARLREKEPCPRLILLSAWAVCLGLTEESSGADAVLAKSNNEQEHLVRAIRQLLARRTVRKPAASEAQPGKTMAKNAASHVARSG